MNTEKLLENEKYMQLLSDVAFCLNEDETKDVWKFDEPKDEENKYYPGQRIVKRDDPSCYIVLHRTEYGCDKGKIEISGNFHFRGTDGNLSFVDVREWNHDIGGRSALPSIKVSASRGAQTIAKEIKKRFLIDYLPLRLPEDSVRWWLGVDGGSEREQIVVSAADALKQPPRDSRSRKALAKPFTVTDLLTGKRIRLQRVDCGLGCMCAMDRVPMRQRSRTV